MLRKRLSNNSLERSGGAMACRSQRPLRPRRRTPQSGCDQDCAVFESTLLATVASATPPGYDREVLDVLTCIRHRTTLDNSGRLLERNAQQCLRNSADMRELFYDYQRPSTTRRPLSSRLHFRAFESWIRVSGLSRAGRRDDGFVSPQASGRHSSPLPARRTIPHSTRRQSGKRNGSWR